MKPTKSEIFGWWESSELDPDDRPIIFKLESYAWERVSLSSEDGKLYLNDSDCRELVRALTRYLEKK